MARGHRLGRWGEAVARSFLEACGYRCLAQGYRRPGGELDLVVGKGDLLVFVEVKTRGPGALAAPEAWVTGRKLRLLKRMARLWLSENPQPHVREFRFDVVAITTGGRGRGAVLRHLTGIG
jgi:putative endonuclease